MNTQETQQGSSVIEESPFQGKRRRRINRSLRVGLFFLIALVLLVLLVFVLGDRRNLFGNTFNITAQFENVEGLRSGAAVFISGIRVGSVDAVNLVADTTLKVRVKMTIEKKYHELITTSSVAAVGQIGLVGDKHVEISTPDVSAPIVAKGSEIKTNSPLAYTDILEEANQAVANTESITASLDTLFFRFRRGEGTLGKFLTDDAAYNELVGVGASAQELFDETTRRFAQLAVILRATAKNVDNITRESEQLIQDLGEGKGTVGALLYDRSLYDSLESLVETLNRTADNAGMAAREFGTNMRGLRDNWLLGGLFSGSEADERDLELMQNEINIQKEELRRQEELLKQRERELLTNP
ncbi:MAG: MCE family protein [Chlorobi bacterium]|nr:MCE family protein [Chlorobiota bacterium]